MVNVGKGVVAASAAWAETAGREAAGRTTAALDARTRQEQRAEAIRTAAAQHGPAWFERFIEALQAAVPAFNGAAGREVARLLPLHPPNALTIRAPNADSITVCSVFAGIPHPDVYWFCRLHGRESSQHFHYALDDDDGRLGLEVVGEVLTAEAAAERLLGAWLMALHIT